EDCSPEACWRWEVSLLELLPPSAAATVKKVRAQRTKHGRHVKAVIKLLDVLRRHPGNMAKASELEEKVLRFARQAEAERQKQLLKEQKEKEKKGKEASKASLQSEKESKAAAKAEEKRLKAEEKRIKAEEKKLKAQEKQEKEARAKAEKEAKKASNEKQSLFRFFKKVPDPPTKAAPVTSEGLAPSSAARGPDSMADFDNALQRGMTMAEVMSAVKAKGFSKGTRNGRQRPTWANITVDIPAPAPLGFTNQPAYSEIREVRVRNRMKLLSFHEDTRPAYWGTWSKQSRDATGRRPLGRDRNIDYEADSEAEWEDEEPGEELLSDDEVEPMDVLDYQDGWLRQDGVFSEGEITDEEGEMRDVLDVGGGNGKAVCTSRVKFLNELPKDEDLDDDMRVLLR
ncbi:unnamed protein product, partial [Chrysoparadoxa australica]